MTREEGPPAAAVADALVRLGLPVRVAPTGLTPITQGARVSGPALPARHAGSVDVFLEALGDGDGRVLVVDNGGRLDEGCIGDLTVLEAVHAGARGVLVWGCHRDTQELQKIPLPVFSYGNRPNGPLSVRPRAPDALQRAHMGEAVVARDDHVVADDDGAVFFPAARSDEVLHEAASIVARERTQADAVRRGVSLRAQFRFDEYLARRADDPRYALRDHLRSVGGEIEV